MLGTIGEQERMDTTVIADSVNLASRLEGLTKHYGVSLIISETTKEKLLNPENFSYRFLGLVQVVGKNTPVRIYEVYSRENNPKLDEIKNDFESALDLYLKAKLKESFESFKLVYKSYPEDKPTIYYLKRIKNYLKVGLPTNWNGVEKISSK
jgi:two-component system sensor histidine kinase ChiS